LKKHGYTTISTANNQYRVVNNTKLLNKDNLGNAFGKKLYDIFDEYRNYETNNNNNERLLNDTEPDEITTDTQIHSNLTEQQAIVLNNLNNILS